MSLRSNETAKRRIATIEKQNCYAIWRALHDIYLPETSYATQARFEHFQAMKQQATETNGDFIRRMMDQVRLMKYCRETIATNMLYQRISQGLKRKLDRIHAFQKLEEMRQKGCVKDDEWLEMVQKLENSPWHEGDEVSNINNSTSMTQGNYNAREYSTSKSQSAMVRQCMFCGSSEHFQINCPDYINQRDHRYNQDRPSKNARNVAPRFP
jgi:hypothetical protein